MMDGINTVYTVTGVLCYNYEICSQKWDIVWKIYLIKLYICSANCCSTLFWIARQHATLRITIDKCMDIFDNMCIYIIT
jgi:hypothetical protein